MMELPPFVGGQRASVLVLVRAIASVEDYHAFWFVFRMVAENEKRKRKKGGWSMD